LLFKTRNALFPLVFVPVGALSRPRLFLGSERADAVLDVIGLAIAFAGEGLRFAVIGLAYIQRGGRKRRIHAPHLVREGLFAHSRNPLYLGNVLMVLGVSLVHNGLGMYLVVLPFFLLAYASIVAAEEHYLRAEFGAEYEEYCRDVPRFLPRLAGLRHTLRSMRFDWKRVLRKEHSTTFHLLTGSLAALAWERVALHGLEASRRALVVLGVLWILVLLAFLLLRYLKKSGALSSLAVAPRA
jgi:protein-S-isoprenylcysteine O-methyltransferase Ste14